MFRSNDPMRFYALLSAVVSAFMFCSGVAHADLYSVQTVSSTQGESFVAGDDYGDYVIDVGIVTSNTNKCGDVPDYSENCYLTYNAGSQQSVLSVQAPTLRSDPSPIAGQGCNFNLSSYQVIFHELCNNGHEIVSGMGYISPTRTVQGVFDGSNPILDQIYGGSLDGVMILTPSGNLFYDNGSAETLNEALDLSTSPVSEPGSLLLLGTGLLATFGLVRRGRRV